MSQILFGTDTTPNLGDLDANFYELYQFKNLFAIAGPKISYGTGNAAGLMTLEGAVVGPVLAAYHTGANPSGINVYYGVVSGTGGLFFWATDTGGIRFQVAGNGSVQNSTGSYGAISDARLKTDITDTGPKLADLLQVRVVNYRLAADVAQARYLGVVAQEIEAIFPGLVETVQQYDASGQPVPGGEPMRAVKYSVFVPMLIKALQEQNAQIVDLQTRLAALEAA